MDDLLFTQFDLRSTLENAKAEMLSKIDEYPAEALLNSSVEDLIEYFSAEASISMVELHEDEIYADQTETTADARRLRDRLVVDRGRPAPVPAIKLILNVPFSGEEDLLLCRASSYSLNPPRGSVRPGMLTLTQIRADHDAPSARRSFDNRLDAIRQGLQRIANDLEPWNAALPSVAKKRIEARRERLLKDRGLVADLGFPLKRRKAEGTYSAPEVRRKTPVRHPPTSTSEPFKPEPTLPAVEYEHILEIISDTAMALERSPATFSQMGEEELRDQFLVPLNSHYEGQATGETFNARGKTDILIVSEKRPVFIAECKIWRGPKSFTDALDQLLSYTTWRDTKTALMIFNKNKNFSAVLEQLEPVATDHPAFKRTSTYEHETGLRVVLGHPFDPAREVTVTILAFDVPE